jgi:DNA-binding transcriptional ArsR family regulator
MQDPWHFQRWAFGVTTGNYGRKAVLGALAVMADTNTGRCEAKLATLVQATEMGKRAISGHLKALEEMGLIARRPQFRRDGGRRGDEFLLCAPEITEWPDGTPVHDLPGGDARNDTTPLSPGASQERPLENDHASKQEQRARESARDQPPAGFPDELRPHARHILRILRDVAEQHPKAKVVWPREVGLAIMAHPRAPLVATAHELAAWAVDPPRPIVDVARTYRTFLARTRDLAAIEQLDDSGVPLNSAGRSATVGRTMGRRDSNDGPARLRAMAAALRNGEIG